MGAIVANHHTVGFQTVFSVCFPFFSPALVSAGFSAAHLLVGDGDEPLLGQFPQGAHVRPHVQLAAHKHHFGVGAELLRLALPLHKQEGHDGVSQKKDARTQTLLLVKV